jgi:predicted ATPase
MVVFAALIRTLFADLVALFYHRFRESGIHSQQLYRRGTNRCTRTICPDAIDHHLDVVTVKTSVCTMVAMGDAVV